MQVYLGTFDLQALDGFLYISNIRKRKVYYEESICFLWCYCGRGSYSDCWHLLLYPRCLSCSNQWLSSRNGPTARTYGALLWAVRHLYHRRSRHPSQICTLNLTLILKGEGIFFTIRRVFPHLSVLSRTSPTIWAYPRRNSSALIAFFPSNCSCCMIKRPAPVTTAMTL